MLILEGPVCYRLIILTAEHRLGEGASLVRLAVCRIASNDMFPTNYILPHVQDILLRLRCNEAMIVAIETIKCGVFGRRTHTMQGPIYDLQARHKLARHFEAECAARCRTGGKPPAFLVQSSRPVDQSRITHIDRRKYGLRSIPAGCRLQDAQFLLRLGIWMCSPKEVATCRSIHRLTSAGAVRICSEVNVIPIMAVLSD